MWIYKVTNTINGKSYIGITTKEHAVSRWSGHKWSAKTGSKYPLHRAIRKYGKSSFVFETLGKAQSKPQLKRLEIEHIKRFNTLVPSGYNISPGGELVPKGRKPCNVKIWAGIRSPDGKVFRSIKNIALFAREHNLDDDKLRQVSRGIRYSYKGWKTLSRDEKIGFRWPVGRPRTRREESRRLESLRKTITERNKLKLEK